MKWSLRRTIIPGFALIALTNAFALIGAAYNRSGEPESTLRLSERELRPPYFRAKRENTQMALNLGWRVLDADATSASYQWGAYGHGGSPAWLDRDKMASLGFDVSAPDDEILERRSFRRQLGRDVLLVLELNGPAYQRSLENATAEAARLRGLGKPESTKLAGEMLERERSANSRLFVVDAGIDLAALRSKYPDRTQYAIVRGQVQPLAYRSTPARRHAGMVGAVHIDAINVPLEARLRFEGAAPQSDYAPANAPKVRYEAVVAFGQRLEPWLK